MSTGHAHPQYPRPLAQTKPEYPIRSLQRYAEANHTRFASVRIYLHLLGIALASVDALRAPFYSSRILDGPILVRSV